MKLVHSFSDSFYDWETSRKLGITESLKEKISKSMQRLVFFIESNDKDYGLASNIGNLYMNRFTIDEDAA